MSKGRLYHLLGFLHKLAGPAPGEQPTDGELLGQFLTGHDEPAFGALMQRHGPMVLATCQRVLRDPHEAEDAFQATFLVLARKAGSICRQASLGSWLHRVAYHIAINARIRAATQRAHEREVALMSRSVNGEESPNPELRQILDEELSQLPEKYRSPLVLCYLEGKTHEEAARELRWPAGSMSRRLSRGQELLHRRLLRRGVALSLAALGSAITASAATAAVPAALTESTAKAAVLLSAAEGAARVIGSAKVASLVEEAMGAMSFAKLQTAAALLLTVGLVSAGTAMLLPSREKTSPVNELAIASVEPEWGQPVHGFRLRCSPDRQVYRQGKDIVRVTFALRNVADTPNPMLLLRDGEELTDLRLVGPDGKEHMVRGREIPLPRRSSWAGMMQPGSVERVSMIFDPEKVDGGLEAGMYRVCGVFRRQPPADSQRPAVEYRLESNDTSFTLTPPSDIAFWPAGESAGPCSLTLAAVGDRRTWKPGDAPLSFSVVLNRLDDDMRTVRWLGSNRLGMYYSLEITGPSGDRRLAYQYAASAGVDPANDPFAYARLMFLQLDRIPVGKSLGERICWDPAGTALERGWQLESVTGAAPVVGPGKCQVRAIYQLRENDQRRFAGDPLAIRLLSNPIEVQIGE